MRLSLFKNYKAWSDEQLAESVCRSADEGAFEELYHRYARLLQGFFFRRMGGDEEQAADLMQDTFMKIWSARADYKEGQSFRTWIFTIAYNLCKNIYRSNQHEEEYLSTLPEEEPAEEDDTPVKLDAETLDKALKKEVALLSEQQQMLFELRFTQELSVREIAEIIGIAEGTVKSRLHTMIQQLRIKLKDYE